MPDTDEKKKKKKMMIVYGLKLKKSCNKSSDMCVHKHCFLSETQHPQNLWVLGDLIGGYWLLLRFSQDLLTWELRYRSSQRKDKSLPRGTINLTVGCKTQKFVFFQCYRCIAIKKMTTELVV